MPQPTNVLVCSINLLYQLHHKALFLDPNPGVYVPEFDVSSKHPWHNSLERCWIPLHIYAVQPRAVTSPTLDMKASHPLTAG